MKTITYSTDVSEFVHASSNALANAREFVIDSVDMLEIVAEELKEVKKQQKALEAKRKSIIDPINAAVKAVNELFKPPKEALAEAESIMKAAVLEFQKAEAVRAAELQAVEAERVAKEKAKLEAEAAEAAAQGFTAAAIEAEMKQGLIKEKTYIAAKAESTQVRVTYHAEVTDIRALLQAILDGVAPIDAVIPNKQLLDKAAREFRKDPFPGVVCVQRETLAVRD